MRTMTWLTLLAAALCCLGPADGGWCKFQAVFNFGDSNSDTGGYWAMFPWQQTPYGMTYFHKGSGRASDGRLVIDFIVQSMGMPFLSPYLKSVGSDYHHGVNFATMGATALQPKSFVTGLSPWYLGIQLNQMKEFANRVMSANGNNGQLPSPDVFGNSLYTIDIGQNDFTSSLAYESIESAKQNLPSVVNQISWTIQEVVSVEHPLLSIGASGGLKPSKSSVMFKSKYRKKQSSSPGCCNACGSRSLALIRGGGFLRQAVARRLAS